MQGDSPVPRGGGSCTAALPAALRTRPHALAPNASAPPPANNWPSGVIHRPLCRNVGRAFSGNPCDFLLTLSSRSPVAALLRCTHKRWQTNQIQYGFWSTGYISGSQTVRELINAKRWPPASSCRSKAPCVQLVSMRQLLSLLLHELLLCHVTAAAAYATPTAHMLAPPQACSANLQACC